MTPTSHGVRVLVFYLWTWFIAYPFDYYMLGAVFRLFYIIEKQMVKVPCLAIQLLDDPWPIKPNVASLLLAPVFLLVDVIFCVRGWVTAIIIKLFYAITVSPTNIWYIQRSPLDATPLLFRKGLDWHPTFPPAEVSLHWYGIILAWIFNVLLFMLVWYIYEPDWSMRLRERLYNHWLDGDTINTEGSGEEGGELLAQQRQEELDHVAAQFPPGMQVEFSYLPNNYSWQDGTPNEMPGFGVVHHFLPVRTPDDDGIAVLIALESVVIHLDSGQPYSDAWFDVNCLIPVD